MIRRLALVFTGGCVGTLARWALSQLNGPWPFGTLIVNVAGAFFLGLLLAWLAKKNESPKPAISAGHSESLRLLFGVGMLGAFTTYSAFSMETVRLLQSQPVAGLGYAGGSLLAGMLAAWCGMKVVR
ncbi:MAG: fluoride efflux transporter FluC [Propionibacteriaceae bacterium]